MKSGLHCRHSEMQDSRDLFVRHAFQIAENDDAAVEGFQFLQSSFDDTLYFSFDITPIESIGPVDHGTDPMVTIVGKLGQVFFVLDLSFMIFAATDFSQSLVYGQAIKPC